jgi:5'-phosphate synthase pdxT subunit
MRIGVLALQGDFDAHRRRLEQLGAEVVLVKKPEQLDDIDGLVIPGGESGTFLKLLGEEGFEKLKQFVRLKPTFGTCAGAILLATEVENPRQAGLGALDIRIRRNAYGRQIDSSIRQGLLGNSPLEMVFIRAPKIERVGPGVEVIATEGADPVAVRQGSSMAATFHPELSDDTRVHQVFLDLVCGSGHSHPALLILPLLLVLSMTTMRYREWGAHYFAGRNSMVTSRLAGLKSKSAVTKTRSPAAAASSRPNAST